MLFEVAVASSIGDRARRNYRQVGPRQLDLDIGIVQRALIRQYALRITRRQPPQSGRRTRQIAGLALRPRLEEQRVVDQIGHLHHCEFHALDHAGPFTVLIRAVAFDEGLPRIDRFNLVMFERKHLRERRPR